MKEKQLKLTVFMNGTCSVKYYVNFQFEPKDYLPLL